MKHEQEMANGDVAPGFVSIAELLTAEANTRFAEARAHETRALLRKLARYVREDCLASMAASPRLAKLSLQVDDYLKRTHDPRSILRGDEP